MICSESSIISGVLKIKKIWKHIYCSVLLGLVALFHKSIHLLKSGYKEFLPPVFLETMLTKYPYDLRKLIAGYILVNMV